MNKKTISIIVVLLLVAGGIFLWMNGDRVNRMDRLGVSYLNGNYSVTFSGLGGNKSWEVTDGKVTTEADKGYYFFWADVKGGSKKVYVQAPIQFTVIEERIVK